MKQGAKRWLDANRSICISTIRTHPITKKIELHCYEVLFAAMLLRVLNDFF